MIVPSGDSERKKNGTVRFCMDYRKTNCTTTLDVYPLLRLNDTLDRLQGAEYFTTLDFMTGYWQVPLEKKDVEK